MVFFLLPLVLLALSQAISAFTPIPEGVSVYPRQENPFGIGFFKLFFEIVSKNGNR